MQDIPNVYMAIYNMTIINQITFESIEFVKHLYIGLITIHFVFRITLSLPAMVWVKFVQFDVLSSAMCMFWTTKKEHNKTFAAIPLQ